jgi:hypothetical protein
MLIDHPTRSADDIARLGADLLRRVVGPSLSPADAGRFVCIDIDTGAFEVADDDLTAIERLHARLPGAETYLGLVGDETTFSMGAW